MRVAAGTGVEMWEQTTIISTSKDYICLNKLRREGSSNTELQDGLQ